MENSYAKFGALAIVIIVLLTPVLYIGGFLAVVVPYRLQQTTGIDSLGKKAPIVSYEYYYRYGGTWTATMFWPAEQIDRSLRPESWWIEAQVIVDGHP